MSLFTGLSLCAWCPALRMPVFICLSSFVSPSSWWCPALWRTGFDFFIYCIICFPLCGCLLAGCLQLFGCVSSCVSFHLSPTLSTGVRLSSFLCFHLSLTSCLSPCVSQFFRPELICLQSCVCLRGDVQPVRLCGSSIMCLSPLSRPSSVSEATCLQSYVCHSGGVLF